MELLSDGEGSVGGGVIDDDDFVGEGGVCEGAVEEGGEDGEVGGFVVGGEEDGEVGG